MRRTCISLLISFVIGGQLAFAQKREYFPEGMSWKEVLAEPDERAVLAACLCLEGYNPVGDSLYFMNPETGDGTWFEHALNPTVTIGHHQFYS